MKTIPLSSLIAFFMLCGCSSSTGTSDEGASGSPGAGDTLRLISEQKSFSSGDVVITNYEYDDFGNLIGKIIGNARLTYNTDTDGTLINSVYSDDGIASRDSQIYHYDAIGGLRRVDSLGFIEGVGVLGVSFFDLYKFEGDLASSLERKILPFEEITINAEIDDSAGSTVSITEFKYDGERLVRELIDADVDGVVDWRRDYTYNSDGTLSSRLQAGTSANSSVFVYEQEVCNHNWGNSTDRYFCVTNNGL